MHVTDATPESASVTVPRTSVGEIFNVAPSAGSVTASRGAVLSTFSVTLVEAVLPALSTTVPLTTWPAPSVPTTTGSGHDSMPDRASAQANVTVTSVWCQPAALGGAESAAVIVGAVASSLTVTLAVALFPARS